MPRAIVVLIFAAYCSGTNTPTLWGSRVIGKKSGSSGPMNYWYEGEFMALIDVDYILSIMTILNGQCIVNRTQLWGSHCKANAGNATITLDDVNAQSSMEIIAKGNITSTTFFVPGCNFTKLDPDEVDLNTSFPLSRFVYGMQSFNVSFAVGGAKSESRVVFAINGKPQCTWFGTKLAPDNSSFCVDLVKDETTDLRIFNGHFPVKINVFRESFVFSGNRTVVVVIIVYKQSGTSPEVAECNFDFMLMQPVCKVSLFCVLFNGGVIHGLIDVNREWNWKNDFLLLVSVNRERNWGNNFLWSFGYRSSQSSHGIVVDANAFMIAAN